jgi:hypothetical protein
LNSWKSSTGEKSGTALARLAAKRRPAALNEENMVVEVAD